MLTHQDIQGLVERIVAVAKPEKIILFGSYADGTATEDSDVDLLVVKDEVGRFPEDAVAIRTSLRDMTTPFDIIVNSKEQFEVRRQAKWHIVYQAVKTGRVLYDRGRVQSQVAQGISKVGQTFLSASPGLAGCRSWHCADRNVCPTLSAGVVAESF